MTPENEHGWPEHGICARCGASLEREYRESPLGLRFCPACFDSTIQEKARQRAAEIYVRGRCSNCGASLINGYRLSQFGVIYCLSCHANLAETGEDIEAARRIAGTQDAQSEPQGKRREIAAKGAFWTSLAVSHLLLFTDALLAPTNGFLPHSGPFFRGLVCLDLLAITLFLAPERLLPSKLAGIWTLLITAGFIILIAWEAASLIL
jgi:hypothetical protein